MDLRFLQTAKAEFWEAASYYEHEQEGLGGDFAREISKRLTGLSATRMRGDRYPRRRANVEPADFRMLSFSKLDPITFSSSQSMHLHREPKSWRGRMFSNEE